MKANWKTIADNTAVITMFWIIIAVVPTWFEPFKSLNGMAVSLLSILLILQVNFLRYSIRPEK